MMRLLAASVIALVVGLPGTAAAAEDLKLSPIGGGAFPERNWVLSLPDERDLTPSAIELRENGKRVDDAEIVPGDAAGPRELGVLLAIDTSESMHGASIEDAMAAARAFAAERRPNQALGVLFFSRESELVLAPTTDAEAIADTLAQTPVLSKGTRLRDAAVASLRGLRDADIEAGSVVLLSDGADVGSEASVTDVANAAQRAGGRIFTVGLRSRSFNVSALSAVAEAAGGVYAEATSGNELRAVYSALGAQLAGDYLIRYRSLAPLGSTVRVEAAVEGFSSPAFAEYDAPTLAATTKRAEAAGGAWTSRTTALVVAVLIAMLLAIAVVLALRRPPETVSDRIGAYGMPNAGETNLLARIQLAARPTGLEQSLRKASWWPRVSEEIELSGIGIAPARLAVTTVLSTLALSWTVGVAGDRPVAGLLLLALVPLAARGAIHNRVGRRRRAFDEQLPDNLQVVASSMRAGHSFAGGLAAAADDADEPARTELLRIVRDEQLGVELDEAMERAARRMASPDLEHVGMVAALQRETGGNTAEVLDNLVDTLRQRSELRRRVRALTAQGRLGGAIVSLLPVAMALALTLLNPDYLQPLLDEPAGRIMIALSVVSMGTGWLVIRRIVNIKV